MSSPDALATVTATLQSLLSGITTLVTTKPPSVARGASDDQINIFLYATHYNVAFRNSPMPRPSRNGERAHPPMPLVLKYIITAYGKSDDDIAAHKLLGRAMSILHDHPLLGAADINGITPDSDLQNQIERVRITPDNLSLEDMSKLWSSFQSAEYRLSVGYEISVVLIESTRTNSTPLPVLKRGVNDRGAHVVAGPSPSLSGLRFINQKPSAELGDLVTLLGSQLNSDDTSVRVQHPQLSSPIDIQPNISSSRTELAVQLPNYADDPDLGSKWPAGFYTLALVTQRPDTPPWTSNSVSLPLSPHIESISPSSAPAGDVVLTIECLPQIREQQNVALLFNNQIISPDSVATPASPTATTTLIFTLEDTVSRATPYVLRLRVDGVDSIPVDFSGTSPAFASDQMVTIS